MLLREIGETLALQRFRRYLSLEDAPDFVDSLPAFTTFVADPPRPWPAICRDPKDDYLLALATEHGVEVLCTGDRDLLELPTSDLLILTPRQLIEQLDPQA